jgi:hypothetical protein
VNDKFSRSIFQSNKDGDAENYVGSSNHSDLPPQNSEWHKYNSYFADRSVGKISLSLINEEHTLRVIETEN